MAMVAQDTFVARLDNGTEQTVAKGQAFPNSHELVRRDLEAQRANPERIQLFRPLDLGDEEAPKSAARTEAPEPEVKAGTPAKAAAAKAEGAAKAAARPGARSA